jgi:hypothetical protein
MTDTLRQPLEEAQDKNWASSKLGALIAAGTVTAEITPLNEVMRIGAFAWAQKVYGDPIIAATVAGGVGFVIESAAAVATADALATKKGVAIVEKVNDKIDSLGASKYLRTNLPTEIGIASVGGSAVATVIKHRQEPERTRTQNRRYGLTSALGIGALTYGEAYLASSGIEHPNPLVVGIGAVAVGALVGSYKWTKRKLSLEGPAKEALYGEPTETEVLPPQDATEEMLIGNYSDILSSAVRSPQKEGLENDEIRAALRDKRTIILKESDSSQDTVPFAVPLEYAPWMNQEFFVKKGYDPKELLYCVLPQDVLRSFHPSTIRDVIEQKKASQNLRKASIVFDYPDAKSPLFSGEDYIVDDLITHQKTPAATYHFSQILAPGENAPNFTPNPHVRRLRGDDIKSNFERIWDIYDSQFQALVDDHPVKGALSKQELFDCLSDEDCHLSAYFDDSDTIMGFGYTVDDIRLCPWLNEEHFLEQAQGLNYVYMPGIATAKEAASPISGQIMLQMINEKFNDINNQPFLLTYECSNLSARYIPKIVRRTLEGSGLAVSVNPHEQLHFYKVVNF